MTPHPACDSAVVPCLHGFQAFLQKHSLRPYLLSCLLRPSLWSQKQSSSWDCSPVPTLQLPVTTRSVGLAFLSGVWRATSQIVCVGLTLFRLWAYQLLHSPAVLTASPQCQLIAPHVGISPLLQLPHLRGARWPCSLSSSFLLPSFILLSFVRLYILLSSGQGLLPPSARAPHDLLHLIFYVPDTATERDVLHVHLLLCHLVSFLT